MKRLWVIVLVALLLGACSDQRQARTSDDADGRCGGKDEIKGAAQTAGTAAKTGGTTAWEGMKTFGKSVGGFFEGGGKQAEEEWKKGQKKTGDKAREGAGETKAQAGSIQCR